MKAYGDNSSLLTEAVSAIRNVCRGEDDEAAARCQRAAGCEAHVAILAERS